MFVLRAQKLVGLALVLLLAACSTTPTATMDHDPAYNFATVQKVSIQPFKRTAESELIISDMQIDRLNESLTNQLQSKGFQVVPNGTDADLILTWHLVMQDKTDIRSFNSMTAYNCWNCRGMGMGATNIDVREYTQGTLIIDMIDPAQKQAVWRSVFQTRIHNHTDPAKAAEARNAAVAASLAQFPPY